VQIYTKFRSFWNNYWHSYLTLTLIREGDFSRCIFRSFLIQVALIGSAIFACNVNGTKSSTLQWMGSRVVVCLRRTQNVLGACTMSLLRGQLSLCIDKALIAMVDIFGGWFDQVKLKRTSNIIRDFYMKQNAGNSFRHVMPPWWR